MRPAHRKWRAAAIWKLSRLTVCWCSSSMAARPNSLAGSRTVAAAKRTGAACCSRSSSSARAMTAGWAGTTAGVKRSTDAGSAPSQGARTSTPVSWSSAAGEIKDRGAGAQRLLPVAARQAFGAAKKSEIGVFESIGADGLDEGDLVAHLVQLALRLFLVEQGKAGRGKRRLGENVFQLPAQQGRSAGNGNLVHRHPLSF